MKNIIFFLVVISTVQLSYSQLLHSNFYAGGMSLKNIRGDYKNLDEIRSNNRYENRMGINVGISIPVKKVNRLNFIFNYAYESFDYSFAWNHKETYQSKMYKGSITYDLNTGEIISKPIVFNVNEGAVDFSMEKQTISLGLQYNFAFLDNKLVLSPQLELLNSIVSSNRELNLWAFQNEEGLNYYQGYFNGKFEHSLLDLRVGINVSYNFYAKWNVQLNTGFETLGNYNRIPQTSWEEHYELKEGDQFPTSISKEGYNIDYLLLLTNFGVGVSYQL